MKALQNQNFRTLIGQLVRYALTGGLASLVNIGLYQLGYRHFGLHPNFAWAIGFISAVVVGYIVHSRWSFRDHGTRDNLARTGSRFVAVSLVSFSLNMLWVWLMVEAMHWPYWAPYPLVLGVTPLIVFSLNRKWVFG